MGAAEVVQEGKWQALGAAGGEEAGAEEARERRLEAEGSLLFAPVDKAVEEEYPLSEQEAAAERG